MAAVYCKYHSETPAQWHCEQCQIDYCSACVTQTLKNQHAPECPVCKQELQSLGAANPIRPFWLRIRDFFIYPAHPIPLLLILALSLLVYLLHFVPGWHVDIEILSRKFPRNTLLFLPIVVVFLKYAHSVMVDTAHGHLKPSALSSDKLFENGMIVINLAGVFFAFYLLEWAANDLLGAAGKNVAIVLSALVTPAAIILLIIKDDLLQALNPVKLVWVIHAVGMPYFIMFVLFYLLTLVKGTLLFLLSKYIDASLLPVIYGFITMYFYLIMFNMMGYVLYQYHEELGFHVHVLAHEQEQASPQEFTAASPELRAIEILIHEGKQEQAVQELQRLVKINPSDIEARDRMLKLLRLSEQEMQHTQQAQDYISYLIDEKKMAYAAKVFETAHDYDKQFRPAKAVERLEMARYLRQNNQGKLAMAILHNLHRDFPSFDRVPEAYLMVAQLLAEKFNDDQRAIQVLEFIIKNYPAHPLRKEVEDYLQIIRTSSAG